uniref:RNase H type-1 domain-containing protein n=1 Tax=Cannabis sativa TaxID=3483 RepID=A0A803P3N7_CANSA
MESKLQLNDIFSSLPISNENLSEASNLQSQLDSLLYKQEIFWKQRSKVHWLRAGDKNTKFFHHKASSRKRTNFIRKLTLDDGSTISNQAAIEAEICRYFSTLFHSHGSSRDATNLLLSAVNSRLAAHQFTLLDAPLTAEEVKLALFQLSGDKAPGSDGLNAYFYQKNWNTLGEDLCTAVLDILNNNTNMASINKTLIVLIPKKSNASSLKDFRPISLCTTLYKIVAKAIANRIKPIMEDIISPTQSVFLSVRLIFDNIFIAQEMIHAINHRKSGKIGACCCSLHSEQLGSFNGISIARSAPAISHLLFADDTLLFAKATQSSCNALQAALQLYNQTTSQRVNFGKEVLLKAVIQAIPSYVMSCYKLPTSICQKIEKLMAQFWWGSFGKNSKTHWKSWDLLKIGLIWKVGNGHSIRTLQDSWVPNLRILRNKKLFRNIHSDAAELVQWASSYLLQYRDAQARKIDAEPTCHLRTSSVVNQAKEESYQLYTDATINDKNSKIGLGAVVKDWNGQVIATVSVPLSAKVTPTMAEAMALRSGLSWCCSVRIPLSTIFTDSKQLANKIHSHKKELSALADVIVDIKNSLSHFPDASVCYTPRDNNTHAHHMAKEALGLDEELVWKDTCPNLNIVT